MSALVDTSPSRKRRASRGRTWVDDPAASEPRQAEPESLGSQDVEDAKAGAELALAVPELVRNQGDERAESVRL